MRKYKVTLPEEERSELIVITSQGSHRSQKVLNALILLNCDEGEFQEARSNNEVVSSVLQISMRKIDRVKKRFVEEGIDIIMQHIQLSVWTTQLSEIKIEVAVWQNHRNNRNAKINWQFTKKDARIKLRRLYPTVD